MRKTFRNKIHFILKTLETLQNIYSSYILNIGVFKFKFTLSFCFRLSENSTQ